MSVSELTIAEATSMFVYVARRVVESQDLLTQADKAIGDGDHGIGMARGFEAVGHKLEAQQPATTGELLKTIGTVLMTSVGGASGAIYGIFFRGGAKNTGDATAFAAQTLSLMLDDGLAAVQERGKARPGDKTMVDALEPAARLSKELATASLGEALPGVAEAARLGMERTKEMVAAIGRAKTLGERSLGHADPGAISTYLILKFMADYVDLM
jgi:phosphoenolpyruvate---glycerone phosphotransferase subunit DhaL